MLLVLFATFFAIIKMSTRLFLTLCNQDFSTASDKIYEKIRLALAVTLGTMI